MPEGAVSVTRPGRWGNPYYVGTDAPDSTGAVALFRTYAEERLTKEPDWLEPLRGKDLACFCSPAISCHAEVLLELANR